MNSTYQRPSPTARMALPSRPAIGESLRGPSLSDGDVIDLGAITVDGSALDHPSMAPERAAIQQSLLALHIGHGQAVPITAEAALALSPSSTSAVARTADLRQLVRPVSTCPMGRNPLPSGPASPAEADLVSADVDSQPKPDRIDGQASNDVDDAVTASVPLVRVPDIRLQPRDLQLLQFLCRYRYATYAQLAARLNTSVDALRHRLPRLDQQGLIKPVKAGVTRFVLWTTTDDGASIAGLHLPAPKRVAWGTIKHTLGLVDLGAAFEDAGEVVLTEAEIRAADMRNAVSDRMAATRGQGHRVITNRPIFAVNARGTGSANALHVPDLVLARPYLEGVPDAPQSIAIELELKRKTPARVRQTLRAYANAPNIGAVYFYTDDKQVRDLINQCAMDTGTADIVVIRRFEHSNASGLLN